jgi:hypothetical protein
MHLGSVQEDLCEDFIAVAFEALAHLPWQTQEVFAFDVLEQVLPPSQA